MARLLVGNLYSHDYGGDVSNIDADLVEGAVYGSQAILWFARSGDVIILPQAPDPEYVMYIERMMGIQPDSLTILFPEPTTGSGPFLTRSNLLKSGFLHRLQAELTGRVVEEIVALMPDAATAELASMLNIEEAHAGRRFFSQGGAIMANSKSAFRAVAAGLGLPLPEGGVAQNREDLRWLIGDLLSHSHDVILKRDFGGGGMGSEIVSMRPIPHPKGAQRAVQITSTGDIDNYLDDRFAWLTQGGRHAVVGEVYHNNARAIFAEFLVTDSASFFEAHGEIVSDPVPFAEFLPAPNLSADALQRLVSISQNLAESMRQFGYRGVVSADAILLSDNQILLTEWNSRITASTHIYRNIGRRLVGPDYANVRSLGEFVGWVVTSFKDAVSQLEKNHLAYNPDTREGVVLVKGFNPSDCTVRYCAVGKNFQEAMALSERVKQL